MLHCRHQVYLPEEPSTRHRHCLWHSSSFLDHLVLKVDDLNNHYKTNKSIKRRDYMKLRTSTL